MLFHILLCKARASQLTGSAHSFIFFYFAGFLALKNSVKIDCLATDKAAIKVKGWKSHLIWSISLRQGWWLTERSYVDSKGNMEEKRAGTIKSAENLRIILGKSQHRPQNLTIAS